MELNGTKKSVKKCKKPFYCEICDYVCFKNQHLMKHFGTAKHNSAKWNYTGNEKCELDFEKKTEKYFHCEFCNYTCSNPQHYAKHLSTAKHFNNKKCNSLTLLVCKKCETKNHTCPTCHKNYKYSSGLYKHLKNTSCKAVTSENQELRQQIIDLSKTIQQQPIITNNNNNSNNIINNNTFNLQIFLNETCKDAINISEFIENIKISLNDVENVGTKGFVKGISNIIIKNLEDLDENKRPVHCSDLKRDTLYIKDNDIWEKDREGNQKMVMAVKHVSTKNLQQLNNWREANPDFNNSESAVSDIYQKIIRESCGITNNQVLIDEPETKIIKQVSKAVAVNKGSKNC
jgi:hypothetical protein